ncbi:hypothetical protein HYU15_02590 [Candidatus Woesearchaeota archaeon]|nr:hypothetical protein [Candidatus Woesearchaeota archaeon]
MERILARAAEIDGLADIISDAVFPGTDSGAQHPPEMIMLARLVGGHYRVLASDRNPIDVAWHYELRGSVPANCLAESVQGIAREAPEEIIVMQQTGVPRSEGSSNRTGMLYHVYIKTG